MSLTSQLWSSDTAVRIFLKGVSPLLSQSTGSSQRARSAAKALGLDAATSIERVVTLPTGLPKVRWSSPIGTAFDYRVRMLLEDSVPDTSLAEEGLSKLTPGTHPYNVLYGALVVARSLLDHCDPREQDRAAVVVAWCESLFRGGHHIMDGPWGKAVDAAPDGGTLVRAIPELVLDDLQRLRNVGGSLQIAAWRSAIQAGERYVLNPGFSGGRYVGGADGDWIVGDTLVDCKTTSKLTPASLRNYLRQLLGYVLLDEKDDLGIRRVAVWAPRYGRTFTWSLAELLGADPDEVLPKLREDFIRVVRNSAQAVAVYEERISAERAKGLIAENRHTPFESLDALGSASERGVRMRAAGNPITPTYTLIRLSRDRRLEVRARSARNPNIPQDVLNRLRDDRSVQVRRAAEAAWYGRTAITAAGASTQDAVVVIDEPRLRDRSGLQGWQRHWLENTELAQYADYRVELLWERKLYDSKMSGHCGRGVLILDSHKDGVDGFMAECERLDREFDPKRWEELDLWTQQKPSARVLVLEPPQPSSMGEPPHAEELEQSPSVGSLWQEAAFQMRLKQRGRTRLAEWRLGREVLSRKEEAQSPDADAQTLLRLSMDQRAEVRAEVARNEKTPVRILEFVSGEKSVQVRRAVLRNANTPERILRSLSKDNDQYVLAGIAHHPSTPVDLRVELTDSDSLLVCLVAVVNPDTPMDTLRAMQDDPDPVVRKVVAATLVYRESAGDEVTNALVQRTGS